MVIDRIRHAKIRNRGEQIDFLIKLQKITLEQQSATRMFEIERQKFRNKVSRMGLVSSTPRECAEVKMYETHNPGFCFTRNGEQKTKSAPTSFGSFFDYQLIHDLVFTNGAVDIEKILCLHLVSAHRSESLLPPKKLRVCKEHSPAEKLLDRSKRGYLNNERLSQMLPMYTVEILEYGAKGEHVCAPVINDGRFAARILVNQKLRELISTVVEALLQANKKKLEQLVHIVHDPQLIKDTIMDSPHIMEFMDTLHENPLITSCESFVLTPPFKIKCNDLLLKTSTGQFELLVRNIRENVLQAPKDRLHNENIVDELTTAVHFPLTKSHSSPKMKHSTENTAKPALKLSGSDISKITSSESEKRYTNKNFVSLNIKAAANTKRIPFDIEEDDYISKKNSSTTSYRSKKHASAKSSNQPSVDVILETPGTSNEREDDRTTDQQTFVLQDNSEKDEKTSAHHGKKSYIKRTTCPACMERWKKPLPIPKTSKVKRSSTISTNEPPVLKTNSLNRIGMMINKELYKLESYDRRFSADNRTSKFSYKKEDLFADSSEELNLSPMDLAKIEQEIKERETRKMLEKFLNETLD